MYFPPPPISYCRECGNDEKNIDRSGNGWGNILKTICRACFKHNEIDQQIKVPHEIHR